MSFRTIKYATPHSIFLHLHIYLLWRLVMTWGSRSYKLLGTRSPHVSKRQKLCIALALTTLSVFILILAFGSLITFNSSQKSTFSLGILGDQVCEPWESKRITKIPNIVHYIWILKDPKSLRLDFKFFIAVYSSYLYFQPDTIYLHTDALPNILEHARTSGDEWTQRTLNLPIIKYHHVDAPNVTTKGVPIKLHEHKSDFLRMRIVHEYGGIYLDRDAIPLRDISDLRESRFSNIVGSTLALNTKYSSYINNGVMLSAPRSALIEIYMKAAHHFFDGTFASIHFLTDLANRLSAIPNEVLILQPLAFSPLSEQHADQVRLFKPHLETSAGLDVLDYAKGRNMTSCKDMLGWLVEKERFGREEWEMDFSASYVLRAFDGEWIHGWDNVVDLNYVLARQSNYARAVYPAVAHAMREGVIPPF